MCFASSFVSAETIATGTAVQGDTNDKVEENSNDLVTEDGFRYQVDYDQTIKITGYQGDKTEISIPNEINDKGVKTIENFAFQECNSLSKINIPEGVETIGSYAFYNCIALKEINIPEGVKHIAPDAFYNCIALKEINIPKGVTKIEESAFARCSSLCEINIPEEVTEIENLAFWGCSSLRKIEIPERVTTIGYSTFWGCSNLREINVDKKNEKYASEDGDLYNKEKTELIRCSISKTEATIPERVTIIRYVAFMDCSSLKEINVDKKNEKYASEDGVLYNKEKTELIRCPIIDKTEMTIPEGVIKIGKFAFYGCNNLRKIEVPKGIIEIGDLAFYGCNNLRKIDVPEGVTTIGSLAFYGCNNLRKIEIPKEVLTIGDYVFLECSNLTIYSEENSHAQHYANRYNIPFKLSSEYDKDILEDNSITKPEESSSTVTPPSEIDVPQATTTPSKDNGQDGDKPANDNGKPNKTSDAASMVGIFTMFVGLIGTIGFKRKRK